MSYEREALELAWSCATFVFSPTVATILLAFRASPRIKVLSSLKLSCTTSSRKTRSPMKSPVEAHCVKAVALVSIAAVALEICVRN